MAKSNGHAPVKSPGEQVSADRELLAVILRSSATALHSAIERDRVILDGPKSTPKAKDSASFRIAQNSGVLSKLTPMWIRASEGLLPPMPLEDVLARINRG